VKGGKLIEEKQYYEDEDYDEEEAKALDEKRAAEASTETVEGDWLARMDCLERSNYRYAYDTSPGISTDRKDRNNLLDEAEERQMKIDKMMEKVLADKLTETENEEMSEYIDSFEKMSAAGTFIPTMQGLGVYIYFDINDSEVKMTKLGLGAGSFIKAVKKYMGLISFELFKLLTKDLPMELSTRLLGVSSYTVGQIESRKK